MRNTESSHLSREPRCSGGWAGVPNSYYTDTPGLLLYFRFATPAPGQTALFACGDAVHSAGQGGNAAAALRNIARRSLGCKRPEVGSGEWFSHLPLRREASIHSPLPVI